MSKNNLIAIAKSAAILVTSFTIGNAFTQWLMDHAFRGIGE